MDVSEVTLRDRLAYARDNTPSVWRMVGRVLGALAAGAVTLALAIAAGLPGIFDHEWVFLAGACIAIVLGGCYDWAYRFLVAPRRILEVRLSQAAPHLVRSDLPVRLIARPAWNDRPMRVIVGVRNEGLTDDFKAFMESSPSLSLGFGPRRRLPWLENEDEFQAIIGDGGVEFFEVAKFYAEVDSAERTWLVVELPFGHKKRLLMSLDQDVDGQIDASWEARISVSARNRKKHASARLGFVYRRMDFGDASYAEVRVDQEGTTEPSAASMCWAFNKNGTLIFYNDRPWQEQAFSVSFADELRALIPDLVPVEQFESAEDEQTGEDTTP